MFNEEIRDAIDDLCDILSEWNAWLLLEYNKDQPDDKCIDNIKDLLNSNDQAVWDKGKSQNLGELTDIEISAMGFYKLAQNHRVQKRKKLPRNIALKRLNIASAYMSPICKQGFEKYIKIINDTQLFYITL